MITANDVIKALGGSVHSGMCRCPVPSHGQGRGDRNPSLKVSDGNSKIVVHCHAGCSQDAVLAALPARGISLRRNTHTPRPNNKPAKSEQQQWRDKFMNQAYPILLSAMDAAYISDTGELVRYQAPVEYLRHRGIDFVPPSAMLLPREQAQELREHIPWFMPYPAMVLPIGSANGLQGASVTYLSRDGRRNLCSASTRKNIRRIYGTSKGGYVQLGVIDPDQPPARVIVAEGIETALSAAQLVGSPAIAVLGANNYEGITPPACGELIIAADNNEVGRQKGKDAGALWAASGRTVRIAVPPEHKDWNDAHRDRNADPQQLKQLLLDGELVKADRVVHAVGMESFMSLQFPPRQYLLKPWLTTTGLAMIDAAPGHGKTWLALSIAYAVACGQPLLDWEVVQRGKVLYVDGELPGELLQSRLYTLGEPLPETKFAVLSRSQFEMRGALIPDLGEQAGRDFLDAEIERLGIDLVILDSVSTLVRSGVDNDVESWRAIQDWSLKHRARGRAIIYLHHHGRSGNPRGTSAREIVLDTRLKLTRDEALSNDDATAFKLEFPKSREFFGAAAAPMMAYLSTQSGTVHWRREAMTEVAEGKRVEIEELLKGGTKPADIAKKLDVSRRYVYHVKKEKEVD